MKHTHCLHCGALIRFTGGEWQHIGDNGTYCFGRGSQKATPDSPFAALDAANRHLAEAQILYNSEHMDELNKIVRQAPPDGQTLHRSHSRQEGRFIDRLKDWWAKHGIRITLEEQHGGSTKPAS